MDQSGPSTSPYSSRQPHQHEYRSAHQADLELRIQSLCDVTQRDDVKLKTLQDLWSSLEGIFHLSLYERVVDKLMSAFLSLFCSTTPQFIAENNTQQLRRLILEIILRMSSVESVKPHSKELVKQMMRLISIENEENAILAIKIIIDQGRSTGRISYSLEVSSAMAAFKLLVQEVSIHGKTIEMFTHREIVRSINHCTDEQLISEYLKSCFHSQTVTLNGNDSKDLQYNLIPSASQSVKVLHEVPYLIVFFYQHFKTSIQTEALDFLRMGFDFLNVRIPQAPPDSRIVINQSLADDFVNAQSKFLSYVNIMAKVPAFLEVINQNGTQLVSGVMHMLEQCPADLITARKEVLVSLKYFTAGDMKPKFFPMLPRLISESAVLGTGFTAIDNLRTFMYQMLADLLHHMRAQLPFEMLTHVCFVFCRTLHDNTTNAQVQIMSARLLNSITESMLKLEAQQEATRDLLFEILEAQVSKLKILAVYHLPLLFKQHKTDVEAEYRLVERKRKFPTPEKSEPTKPEQPKPDQQRDVRPKPAQVPTVSFETRTRKMSIDSVEELELEVENVSESTSGINSTYCPVPELPPPDKHGKTTTPEAILNAMFTDFQTPAPPLSLADTRNLIKFIMQTCKFVTGQLKESRPTIEAYHCARERDLFERLLKYGIMCMEVFAIPIRSQANGGRSKDEKDTLESLAHVFTTIEEGVFRELFEKYMDFLIVRIVKNYPIQLMVNTFLVRNEVPFFASIMLQYLMTRLSVLSTNNEKTNLYVKLFKIIFSAIGTAQPNFAGELMLKPHLPGLIRQSCTLALTAKEPLNYFVLLRGLFRSIGGGQHDILYSQFLPLLPDLLQFLNKLQSCQHRPTMRELFIELCLTVPVRLSSLLPYLPLLMDPLVCALNGSASLVQQGLRTLELCVDNLQPDYLFEHMAPVRGALMQGLWKIISKSKDHGATTSAFRILGKFGGVNRKMLCEPQPIKIASLIDIYPSYLNIEFERANSQPGGESLNIHLPISELMKTAVDQMKQGAPGSEVPIQQPTPHTYVPLPSLHVKTQCMELAKAVLFTGIGPTVHLTTAQIGEVAKHIRKKVMNFDILTAKTIAYKCSRENDRNLFVNALLVLFYGVISKDPLRSQYLKFFNQILRQFALIGAMEFVGGIEWQQKAEQEGAFNLCMDSCVLVDALVIALADSNNEFMFSAIVALRHINDIVNVILPDPKYMSRVPLCRYLMEKIVQLCHGPAWFARLGGATALAYIIDHYPKVFLLEFIPEMVENLMEVILGTADEIASGSPDVAIEAFEKLHKLVLMTDDAVQKDKYIKTFLHVYAKNMFHGTEDVRKRMSQVAKSVWETSKEEETYEKFLYRYRSLFKSDIERIICTANHMSLGDSIGSFDSFYQLAKECPKIYEFEENEANWNRFVDYLLDVTQTSTDEIAKRNQFLKCETCPGHFIPPTPILQQVIEMKGNALKCLIVVYEVLKLSQNTVKNTDENSMEVEDTEETIRNELGLNIAKFTSESITNHARGVDRILVAILNAVFDVSTPKVSNMAHEELKKKKPIALEVLQHFGKKVIDRLNKSDLEDKEVFTFTEIARFKSLYDLNPAILTNRIATNLTEQVCNWILDERVSKVLTVPPNPEGNEELETLEKLKRKSFEDVQIIDQVYQILTKSNNKDIVTEKIAIDLVMFAADFEYTYSQNLTPNFMSDVVVLATMYPEALIQNMITVESLADDAKRSILRRLIVYPEALPLRKVFIENSEILEKILEGKYFDIASKEWKEEDDDDERIMWTREMFALTLMDKISKHHNDWLVSPKSPIPKLHELWNNAEFKQRYVVRITEEPDSTEIHVKHMTEHKFKVPKLIVNMFLRYLRGNHEDIELLFDVIAVFIGNYVTDFTYVREFLEAEVIPSMPLQWRRDAFLKIMEMFETIPEKTCSDLKVVKTLQYLIIPCLQWAFERYDVDKIVGITQSPEASDDDPENLVSRLAKVIETHRQKLSDGMVIVFYQLCTLFVKHASHHIHNNSCKKQGGRLRVFMLFAWPCLTLQNHQDPTMRFTGFFFLANIIERFTINRKIVLQVFQCLTMTYQTDHRDQIRKAIDILTPAVPIRMEDGHAQILASVRKILIEECHNLPHIQHVFQMVVRNYRVYFYVRHELITPLMNAVQRALLMPNSVVDAWVTRRMAIEVCEMVIKWELLRNQKEQQISLEEAQEVDRILEKLKSPAPGEKAAEESSPAWKQEKDDQMFLQRCISRDQVDQIVNMLVRFCVTFQQQSSPPPNSQLTPQDLIKKSQGLLRAALKPDVWGEYANVRVQTLEKYLLIPTDAVNLRLEGAPAQYNNHCTNAQCTLDLLNHLVSVMPKTLLLNVLRPLQRSIINCMTVAHQALARPINNLIAKLFEKTNCSATGLDELELLSQFLGRYLNEQFVNCVKNPNAPTATIFNSFSLLRTICVAQPAYLESICLGSFLKIVEKASKEHISHMIHGQETPNQKSIGDLICLALDLVRVRIGFLPLEAKKTIALNVLSDLVLKTNNERVIQSSLKLVTAMLTTNDMELTMVNTLPLLCRLQYIVMNKFTSPKSKELVNDYLQAVLRVYECPEFRISENGTRLWEGFFSGLVTPDPELRERFCIAWEGTWPAANSEDVVGKMKHILQNQDWSKFKENYWLRHALWSILRSVPARNNTDEVKRKRVLMLNCASPWRTFEYAGDLKECNVDENLVMNHNEMEPNSNVEIIPHSPYEEKVRILLEEQSALLEESIAFDFAEKMDCISHITFELSNTKVIGNIWVIIFKSFWASLNITEVNEFQTMLEPFMGSGVHNSYTPGEASVLPVWLEAVSTVSQLPPSLIEFIATKHQCWHLGVKLLEQQVWRIPKQLNNTLIRELYPPMEIRQFMATLESLASVYMDLNEFDQYSAVWERKSMLPETVKAIGYVQLGDMENANELLSHIMTRKFEAMSSTTEKNISPLLDKEYDHWMDLYMISLKELSQWTNYAEMSNSKDVQSSTGMMMAGVHLPDWTIVEECRNMISGCIPPKFYLDFTLYSFMLNLMRNNENLTPPAHKDRLKYLLGETTEAHVHRWRSLPSVMSYAHGKLLQSAQNIREVEEAIELRVVLEELTTNPPAAGSKAENMLLADMKTLIKVWRNRTPTVADEVSFCAQLYAWRQQFYNHIVSRIESWEKTGVRPASTVIGSSHSILPIHSMAQAQISFAKIAKDNSFYELAKDSLNKLSNLQSIPILDSHNKVCLYAKTLRDAGLAHPNEDMKREMLLEALETLEDFRADEVHKDQMARMMFLRANINSILDQNVSADNSFQAVAQFIDLKMVTTNATVISFYKNWGNHLDKMFFNSTVNEETANKFARQAIACYFAAARVDSEQKSKKYIAKIFWLAKHMAVCGLSCFDAMNRIIANQVHLVNIYNWVYWLPQLINEIKYKSNSNFILILIKLVAVFPMQVFYYLRDLMQPAAVDRILEQDYPDGLSNNQNDDQLYTLDDPFTRLIKLCLKYRPTDVRVLHRILREYDNMAELWVEKHLRYAIAVKEELAEDMSKKMDNQFHSLTLSDGVVKMMNDWKTKLIEDKNYYDKNYEKTTFDLREERNVHVKKGYISNEPVKIVFEKEICQNMSETDNEYEFVTSTTATLLQSLSVEPSEIHPVKQMESLMIYIKEFRRRMSKLPSQLPLEVVSPFLARFNQRFACIDMPFDLLNVNRVRNNTSPNSLFKNQVGIYYSLIARFEPKIEIVQKGGQVMRRLGIRGQNGKMCSFYLRRFVKEQKTNRVPQLMSHLNSLLHKDRETTRRHLNVPSICQLRASLHTVLYEIASIQPYSPPIDSGTKNIAGSVEIIHPYDILANSFNTIDYTPDDVVKFYYERFGQATEAVASHNKMALEDPTMQPQVFQQQLAQRIIHDDFTRDLVSCRILYDYLMMRYPDSTMHYMMRKQFVHCLGVLSVIEYHFNLTPLRLDQMMIATNTGVLYNPNYRFELAPKGTNIAEMYLIFGHEVPFRLTPNISILVGVAQDGDFMWGMAATARCLNKRSPDVVMRPLLWDENADNVKSNDRPFICHATSRYVKAVLKRLECTNHPDAKSRKEDIASQISKAKDSDNLCRMSPTYYPWF